MKRKKCAYFLIVQDQTFPDQHSHIDWIEHIATDARTNPQIGCDDPAEVASDGVAVFAKLSVEVVF